MFIVHNKITNNKILDVLNSRNQGFDSVESVLCSQEGGCFRNFRDNCCGFPRGTGAGPGYVVVEKPRFHGNIAGYVGSLIGSGHGVVDRR